MIFPRIFLVTLAALLSAPAIAAADLEPDTTYDERRRDALERLAAAYRPADATGTNCVRFGFSSLYLAATLRAGELDIPGGASPEEMAGDIEALADNALVRVGQGGRGPCSWENAGSPAALHGALGLGLILHQWGDQLPAEVRAAVRAALEEGGWREVMGPYIVNGSLSLAAGYLLGGEAIGRDSELWQRGRDQLERIFERARITGGLEMNSPTYTHYHYAALAPLTLLEDAEARAMARILLEYELAVQGHLYLPGGGLGAPQSRDRNGGVRDGDPSGLHRMIAYLTGEEHLAPATNVHIAGPAIAGYALPHTLRALFLDKAGGYEMWAYADAPVEASRMPEAVYPFLDGGSLGGVEATYVSPWHAVVLPGGQAMIGAAYGTRYQAIHVSMGVYVRAPDGSFPILYQMQPFVSGDTHDGGGRIPADNGDADPEDWVRELYDYERFMVGRTLISLWDPTLANKEPGVVRQRQETRVHLPDYAALGGEATRAGDWYAARLGEVYVAYLPLGEIVEEQQQGDHRVLVLAGRSGGVFELASTADFPDLAAYAANLAGRRAIFEAAPLVAEVEALDPDSGELVVLRLEHRPERRFVDGVELGVREALDGGWLRSPWVAGDAASGKVELGRGCLPRLVYDWEARAVTEEPADGDCVEPPGGDEPPERGELPGGCGCRAGGSAGFGALATLALAALALARRRRRGE